jgi:hypothetical protein
MNNGNDILAAVLSLREAAEQSFNRIDARLDRLETRFGHFEVRVLARFDAMDQSLDAMDRRFDSLGV